MTYEILPHLEARHRKEVLEKLSQIENLASTVDILKNPSNIDSSKSKERKPQNPPSSKTLLDRYKREIARLIAKEKNE